ncbi:unnamed protein product [Ixodes pacificus]
MSAHAYQIVEGLHVSNFFHEDNIRSAMTYKPRDGDILVVGYPKSGTAWLQRIVYSILNDGRPPSDDTEAFIKDAMLEVFGGQAAANLPRIGAIRCHLPFDMAPFSPAAKYVFICRNPYDVCVSFFHHTKRVPAYGFKDGKFEDFLTMFLDGKVDFGDYFRHLLSWYEHLNAPNVFMVTYEDLKADTKGKVLKIADFLGDEHGRRLRTNAGVLNSVMEAISFSGMKESETHERAKSFYDRMLDLPQEYVPKTLPNFSGGAGSDVRKPITGNLFRKGIVGDWREHFSEDDVARMKEWISLKTGSSRVMELWKNVDLP